MRIRNAGNVVTINRLKFGSLVIIGYNSRSYVALSIPPTLTTAGIDFVLLGQIGSKAVENPSIVEGRFIGNEPILEIANAEVEPIFASLRIGTQVEAPNAGAIAATGSIAHLAVHHDRFNENRLFSFHDGQWQSIGNARFMAWYSSWRIVIPWSDGEREEIFSFGNV